MMGLREWLNRVRGRPGARAPSSEFERPLDAIAALVRLAASDADGDRWITLWGEADGRSALIELAQNEINFCRERIDLPSVLIWAGLEALAGSVKAGGRRNDDQTRWTAEGCSPYELAAIVDAVFSFGFELGAGYTLEGQYHD